MSVSLTNLSIPAIALHPMTEAPPTPSVIQRAQAGDEAAFRQLFLENREMVARVVFRIMGPSSEVEDVVQEVFLHVYRSINKFRGESKFSTWLYRLASNVTKMHLRKKRSRPRMAYVDVPEKVEESGNEPDLLVERRQRARALHRLVQGLSEKKREVLVLHDFEGVPAVEVAKIVGAPVLTVRTRLFYARKELYAALEGEPSLQAIAQTLKKKQKQSKKARAKNASV